MAYKINEKTGKVHVMTHLDTDLAERLMEIADKEDRPLSSMIRVLMREAIEHRKVLA
jgi:predicted transcriptional regulator